MSTTGNVAAIKNGQTATLYADDVNEKNMVYFKNTSGASRTSGQVVVLDPASTESFKTTTTLADPTVLGVIPQIDDVNRSAATQTIIANASGYVQFAGKICAVNMSGTTTKGQFLIASATAGNADPVSAWQRGVFGVATSACTGAGTVSAILFPAAGGNAFLDSEGAPANISTTSAVGSSVYGTRRDHVHGNGLGTGVNLLGSSTASQFIKVGTVSTNGSGDGTVTYPVAFPTATDCVVVTACVSAAAAATAYNASASGFSVKGPNSVTLYWLAVGH